MRLGCLGCLGTLLGLAAALTLIGAGAWAWSRAWTAPPLLAAGTTRPEASGVDRKLAGLDRETGNRPATRSNPVILSEAEVSTVASRFLGDAGLLTSSLATEMREGGAVVQWQGPVGGLLQASPFGWLAAALTRPMSQSPVWITLAGGIHLAEASRPGRPRYAEVRLTSARIGRLPVPGWLLTMMAGPRGASLLRWPVPATVERLELGDRQLTIRTR